MKTINPSTASRINGERSRTIKFYTLGCKVNQYDTESIREKFLAKGFKEIAGGRKPATYLINTCTVTASADQKSRAIIRRCIKENPKAQVIVTGCLVDKDYLSLSGIKGIDFLISKRFFSDGISSFSGHTRAFLKVQDGCDNRCSYCKVPLVRGKSRSRPLIEVIEEAKRLVENGFKEIVLTGICLGAFGRDLRPKVTLVDLIDKLEGLSGLSRIRLSSIEARDVTDSLIKKMAQSNKLCRHLHIPIQSGDDEILKRMRRNYTRRYYLSLIRKIKKVIPGIAITTDCLVGFPGESDKHFQNTVDLVKKITPLRAHVFPYSQRTGTGAANFNMAVNSELVKERAEYLKKVAGECSLKFQKRFLGRRVEVLIESRAKEDSTYWEGHTDNYIKVLTRADANLVNQIIPLRLKKIEKGCSLAVSA